MTSSLPQAGSKEAAERIIQARALPGARRPDVLPISMPSRTVRNPKSSSILTIAADPQRHRARLLTWKITFGAAEGGYQEPSAWGIRPGEQCRFLPLFNVF